MDFLASAGFFVFAVAVGWGAVYFIRKSRGRTWMQWTATVLGFGAGLLAVGSFVADALGWATGLIPYSAGALLFVAFVVVFISLLDKKPDIATVICAMGIPLIIAVGLVQIQDAWDQVEENANQVKTTIEQQAEGR
jgi:peptidoglycan/LPS O-acetylase OafA/YrhL